MKKNVILFVFSLIIGIFQLLSSINLFSGRKSLSSGPVPYIILIPAVVYSFWVIWIFARKNINSKMRVQKVDKVTYTALILVTFILGLVTLFSSDTVILDFTGYIIFSLSSGLVVSIGLKRIFPNKDDLMP